MNDVINFLTYSSLTNGSDFTTFSGVANDANWSKGKNATAYWLKPNAAIGGGKGKLGGLLWRDNGALAGVFEPGAEAVLAGRTMRLFDAAGTTQLAVTTTNSTGHYLFNDLDAGNYVVAFARPTGERFAAPDVGSDDARDSDADPLTGRVTVTLNDDHTDIDAGSYYAASVADTDADGDPLPAALGTGPAHGYVALGADGTFTCTSAGFGGQVQRVVRSPLATRPTCPRASNSLSTTTAGPAAATDTRNRN